MHTLPVYLASIEPVVVSVPLWHFNRALRSSPPVATVSLAVAATGVTYNGWAALNLSTGLAPKSLSLRSSAFGAAEPAFVAAAMADLSCTGSIPLDANPCGCTSGV